MKRSQILILVFLLLLFFFAAFWKHGFILSEGQPVSDTTENHDRTALLEFRDHYSQASALQNDQQYETAAHWYEKALALNHDHEGTLYNLGNVNLLIKEFSEAEKYWRRLSQINPRSARAWLQLGTLYFCRDDQNSKFNPQLAKENYLKASDLNREETGPLLKLSKLAVFEKKYPEAEKYADIVLAQNYRSYQAYFLKGYIEWKKGNESASSEILSESKNLFDSYQQVKMAGEGATAKGSGPMLSGDMYCDFFGTEIELVLEDYKEPDPRQVFKQFERRIFEELP
ncbi:MAG: tetratricopeptide repeat protein [Balneolaceae bacterium]